MTKEIQELAEIIKKSPCWNRAQTNIRLYEKEYLSSLCKSILDAGYSKPSLSEDIDKTKIRTYVYEFYWEMLQAKLHHRELLPSTIEAYLTEQVDKIMALLSLIHPQLKLIKTNPYGDDISKLDEEMYFAYEAGKKDQLSADKKARGEG